VANKTIANEVRKAALGRLPAEPWSLSNWLQSNDAFRKVYREHIDAGWYATRVSNHVRRMFLLFVAEALSS